MTRNEIYWNIYFFIIIIFLLTILAYEPMNYHRGCGTWQVTAKMAQPFIFFSRNLTNTRYRLCNFPTKLLWACIFFTNQYIINSNVKQKKFHGENIHLMLWHYQYSADISEAFCVYCHHMYAKFRTLVSSTLVWWCIVSYTRADARFAPSQWRPLQSNAVSHWLGTNIESIKWTGSALVQLRVCRMFGTSWYWIRSRRTKKKPQWI